MMSASGTTSVTSSRKRPLSPSEDLEEAKDRCSSYVGYVFPEASEEPLKLDRVSPFSNITPQEFFQRYIAARRPCVITSLPDACYSKITPELLLQLESSSSSSLDSSSVAVLQVEKRKNTTEAFGQNRTSDRQVSMSMKDLFQAWNGPGGDLYYLSTQQQQKCRNDNPSSSVFLGPCQQLLAQGHILESLPLAGNLLLESCNLWMGVSQCSSSGLHHDYHDNFYLMLQGQKEFRLYAPNEYPHMSTFGNVECLHPNGLLSYYHQNNNNPSSDSCGRIPVAAALLQDNDGKEEDSSADEEEEAVIGKGFDYKSDSGAEDDFVDFDDENGIDDYEQLVEGADTEEEEKDNETTGNNGLVNTDSTSRPDSFSPIDPTLARDQVCREYPSFASCKECIVNLEAGEVLYLPASWFHCVTSSPAASASSSFHMAINYWYYPPDRLDSYQNPYRSDIRKEFR